MRELQLVGYTADLLHLVFTDEGDAGGRFKAPIDDDFITTLNEIFELADPGDEPKVALGRIALPESRSHPSEENGRDGAGTPSGGGPLAGMAVAARMRGRESPPRADPPPAAAGETPTAVEDSAEPTGDGQRARSAPSSKLAPREIQSLLRAGVGPRAVAKQAGTDEQWVRRWMAPIEAECKQVLEAVWDSYVAKTRLGRSAHPVGEAVRRNLLAKGLDPDDASTVEWRASRREGDSYWKVTLRYRSRGRAQRALWRYNPDTRTLDPRNTLAVDVAWTRSEGKTAGKKAADTEPAGKKAAGKKAAGKKAAGKKAAGKKTAGKKTAGKKTAGKKTAGKKTAGKKTAGKKTAGKKTAGKKTAGKKTAGKKTAG